MDIEIRPLCAENFADFEALTKDEGGGGCYCAFWHQRFSSMDAWMSQCKNEPLKNRTTIWQKLQAGFHVGVLAYEGTRSVGWISVAPLPEFYWAWRRVAALGEAAGRTLGIVCITAAPDIRGHGFQEAALAKLRDYARAMGWESIEGYPFDPDVVRQRGVEFLWPGATASYERLGYARVGPHWLSQPGYERSIYRSQC